MGIPVKSDGIFHPDYVFKLFHILAVFLLK